MKKLGFLFVLVFFASSGLIFAQWGDTSASSAPKIIKSKTIYKADPYGHLNDAGLWLPQIVIRVELREETGGNTPGQRYTFLTVVGLMREGGRIETLRGSDLQFYQSAHGGKRSEYDYDNY